MKRYFKMFYVFLFSFFFFSIRNVYAESYITVCSDCQYTTLDQALSDIQAGYYSDYDYIDIDLFDHNSSNYSISRDYRLPINVNIYQDYPGDRNITINGNGHTLTVNNGISFNTYDADFEVKNLEIVGSCNYRLPYLVSIKSEEGSNLVLDSVSITNTGSLNSNYQGVGLFIYGGSATIKNSTFTNFGTAITNFKNVDLGGADKRVDSDIIGNGLIVSFKSMPITIDSCDFYDNAFSIYGCFDGTIQNSKVSSIFLLGFPGGSAPDPNEQERVSNGTAYLLLDETNDYGVAKVKRFNYDDVHFENEEDYIAFDKDLSEKSINHEFLYAINNNYSTIEIRMKKRNTIDISATQTFDFLSYFVDVENVNYNNYEFHVSDLSIANVVNGKVMFLKDGEVDVTALDTVTGDEYTFHFVVEGTLPSNPKTYRFLWLTIIILLLLSFNLFILHKKQESTI